MKKVVGMFVIAMFVLTSAAGWSDNYCGVVVTGCNKKAKVCIRGGCSIDAQNKAKNAFKNRYNCQFPSVSSYSGQIETDKCEL